MSEADPGAAPPYPYDGPPALREPILAALRRVVDPELALSIVDVGLVYGVSVTPGQLQLRLTMTSAACPMADLIIDDACTELEQLLPAETVIEVALVWEPAWAPERMSDRARAFMGW